MNEYSLMFLRFLKEQKLYDCYAKNLLDNMSNTFVGLDYFFKNGKWNPKKHHEMTFISYAFSWCETKEGYHFWGNVNHKWLTFLNEKIKKDDE